MATKKSDMGLLNPNQFLKTWPSGSGGRWGVVRADRRGGGVNHKKAVRAEEEVSSGSSNNNGPRRGGAQLKNLVQSRKKNTNNFNMKKSVKSDLGQLVGRRFNFFSTPKYVSPHFIPRFTKNNPPTPTNSLNFRFLSNNLQSHIFFGPLRNKI